MGQLVSNYGSEDVLKAARAGIENIAVQSRLDPMAVDAAAQRAASAVIEAQNKQHTQQR